MIRVPKFHTRDFGVFHDGVSYQCTLTGVVDDVPDGPRKWMVDVDTSMTLRVERVPVLDPVDGARPIARHVPRWSVLHLDRNRVVRFEGNDPMALRVGLIEAEKLGYTEL